MEPIIEVIDNKDLKRFLVRENLVEIGYVDYIDEDELCLTYMLVHPEFRGQGKAKIIAQSMYNEVKSQNQKARVTCKVLKGILESDEKYKEILK